jgi:hypothetical protein
MRAASASVKEAVSSAADREHSDKEWRGLSLAGVLAHRRDDPDLLNFSIEIAVFKAPNCASLDDSAGPMTDTPESPFAGLSMERTIQLRWALRDVKAKRTKFMPVKPDDLRTLIELALIEIRGEVPVLTNEGERAIGWL